MKSFVKLTLELPHSAADVFTPPEDDLGPRSLYFLMITAQMLGKRMERNKKEASRGKQKRINCCLPLYSDKSSRLMILFSSFTAVF